MGNYLGRGTLARFAFEECWTLADSFGTFVQVAPRPSSALSGQDSTHGRCFAPSLISFMCVLFA